MTDIPASPKDEIAVSRARLEAITVYDVTEDELEIIERGSPSSNYLNFSIALISIFFSFLITLLVTEIKSDRTFMFISMVTVISAIAGAVLLMLWIRTNKCQAPPKINTMSHPKRYIMQ